jgi:hypothetical protein
MGCVGVDRSVGAMTKYRVTRFVTGCSRCRILEESATDDEIIPAAGSGVDVKVSESKVVWRKWGEGDEPTA